MREIKQGETIYSTGCYLTRDITANGGWVLSGFEDDSYFQGLVVQTLINKDSTVLYYVEYSNEVLEFLNKQIDENKQE